MRISDWSSDVCSSDLVIVPLLAGGSVDQTARFFASELSKALGQPVVVENMPGADGAIGLGRLAQASPDGYTFAVSANSFQTISPLLSEVRLPYDTTKDFTGSEERRVGKKCVRT